MSSHFIESLDDDNKDLENFIQTMKIAKEIRVGDTVYTKVKDTEFFKNSEHHAEYFIRLYDPASELYFWKHTYRVVICIDGNSELFEVNYFLNRDFSRKTVGYLPCSICLTDTNIAVCDIFKKDIYAPVCTSELCAKLTLKVIKLKYY